MYDRSNGALFETAVYNDDYSYKKDVDMKRKTLSNNKISFLEEIEAYHLVESYKNGELKGKLKEIAATLDDESNPVIMLVKYKK